MMIIKKRIFVLMLSILFFSMFLFSVSDINMGNKWGKTINRIELIVNLMKEGVLSEDKIISLFNLDMELKESGKYKNMKAMEFENFKLSVFEKRDNNNCETTIVEFYFNYIIIHICFFKSF